jgi:hypothetical protein
VAQGIKDQKATGMEDIAHHAQDPIVPLPSELGSLCQSLASPDDDIVGQAAQQHHHLLRLKAFFAALGTAQALGVALERGLLLKVNDSYHWRDRDLPIFTYEAIWEIPSLH